MKQGEKVKLIAALAILVVAIGLIGWQLGLFGDGRPTAAAPAPTTEEPVQPTGGGALPPRSMDNQ